MLQKSDAAPVKSIETPAAAPTPQIEFVRATSTIADAIDVAPTAAVTAPHEAPRNSTRDYVSRRMELWDDPLEDSADRADRAVELGAICHLPLALQVAFRQKMLTIFAIQLFFVWALVTLFVYEPHLKDSISRSFRNEYTVLAPFFAMALLLLVLYGVRNRFPWNWFVLLCFSVTQGVFFAALGVVFKTNVGVFNCGFTFCCVCLMILLAGVRRNPAPESTNNAEGTLLSSFAAGMVSYTVVAVISSVLFAVLGSSFVSHAGFALTLAFQFVLLTWFSFDASAMYRVMSPDEYMHGVIYFYTDLILLIVVGSLVAGTVAICTVASGGGDVGGACVGCTGCYCGPTGRNEEEEVMSRV
ncbi:TPA: hypothetical protein N0F65_012018 [Lagenidium giganteum]|uniref:Uncharacterized protein n=1 Tax=Lagenidium giganteum TaxID=4803 RepID=A0AAV2YPJ7_9STRA|nr:TPA: hypothetical protein N0F65_008715 [Lagenidium giganteum]DBA02646.1 TPA: hypothetical protein N0F65_012018 [Lagenidium giganteum]